MGLLLSLADKFDTITGSFSLGLIPTGSQDPFALRRQTIGVLNILIDAGWNINCDEVFAYILEVLGTDRNKREDVIASLHDYFALRLKNILQDTGFDYHIIDCVLQGDSMNAAEIVKRATALRDSEFSTQEELLQAYTRVANMVKDAQNTDVDDTLFETEEEKALYAACLTAEAELPQAYAVYDYRCAVEILGRAVSAINNFLDNVLVMHEKEAVKNNRMNLLTRTLGLISPVGDIKKLS